MVYRNVDQCTEMNYVKSIYKSSDRRHKDKKSKASIPGIIIAVYIFYKHVQSRKALISFVVSACPSVYLLISTSLPLGGFP